MTVILMLLTISFFLILDHVVQRARSGNVIAGLVGDWLGKIPRGVSLTVNHTWIRPECDGVITFGIDSLLAGLAGSSARVSLPEPAAFISHDQHAAGLSIGRNMLGVACPVSGSIVEVNKRLLSEPSLLTSNPYGDGWLLKVRPLQSKNQSRKFLVARKIDWLRNQALSMREFLAAHTGTPQLVSLQDGGLPVAGALALLDGTSLSEFGKSFVTLSANLSDRKVERNS